MAEVLYYAIPFFVLLLVLEYLSFRQVQDEHADLIGYSAGEAGSSSTRTTRRPGTATSRRCSGTSTPRAWS